MEFLGVDKKADVPKVKKSVTIIDKTKPPSPIFVWKPHPTIFKTNLEEQKYWAEEQRRNVEGYGAKMDTGEYEIPGTLYFNGKNAVVKERTTGDDSGGGNMIRYEVTDGGLFFHQHMRNAKKNKRATFAIKGRGFGLSTDGMLLAFHTWKTRPGSTALITSKGQDELYSLYNDKFKPVLAPESSIKMDPRVFGIGDIASKNESIKKINLQMKVRHYDKNGDRTTSISELYCKETTHSDAAAKGFSGKGADYAFLDELPLNKRRDLLLGSIWETFKNPRKGPGILALVLMGGSCEFGLSAEDLLAIKEFWDESELLDVDRLFLSATWNKCMTNGHTDHKRAQEEIEKRWEVLAKHPNPNKLIEDKMNNPITIGDVWNFAQGKFFSKPVMDILSFTAKEVAEKPPLIIRCDLVNKDGVTVVEDKKANGDWYILERCKPNADYYMQIDGVASGKTTGGKKGSAVGLVVMKGYDPTAGMDGSYYPVAASKIRPDEIEDSYDNIHNAFLYYNQHGGFQKFHAEGNAGTSDHFSSFLKAKGLSKYIPFAKDVSGKGYVNTDKPFQFVTGDIRDYQVRQANPFLKLHGHKIKILILLTDLLKGKEENSDLRDAFLMFFCYMKIDFYLPIKKVVEVEPEKDERPVIVTVNGKTHRIWK